MSSKNNNKKSAVSADKSKLKAERHLFLGSKKAIFGGFLAGSIALLGQWLVGQAYSGYKARQLLEAVASPSLYLAGAVVTASATTIALMLTMLSLTKQSEGDFDIIFFHRIQRIAFLSTISLIAGVLLLLFLSIPFQESEEVPGTYFKVLYYVLITFVASLSGLLVTIVLMLLNAVNSLIDVVRPEFDEEVDEAKTKAENNPE